MYELLGFAAGCAVGWYLRKWFQKSRVVEAKKKIRQRNAHIEKELADMSSDDLDKWL